MFLDRDGTLVEEVAYLHDPDRVVLLPGVGSGLRRLAAARAVLEAAEAWPPTWQKARPAPAVTERA